MIARSEGDGARRPATIYDVARVAGVSHQTVSRLLKGEGIKPVNRERVMDALRELDYRPNLSARSLATSRSHRVAVLTDGIGLVGPGRIVQGAVDEARASGYLLDIVTVDVGDRAAVEDAIHQLGTQDVGGVVALASTDGLVDLFETTDFRIPAVIGAESDDARGGFPTQLNAEAIPALVEHLTALGHRRFLHISGPSTWVAARNRERAIRGAVAGYPDASLEVVAGDWSARSGHAAISRDPFAPATAVIAANDQMALGAMLALDQLGRSVPEDVSVTGIDDIPEAAFLNPPLTTLRVDFTGQGRDMFRRALAAIRGVEPDPPVQSAHLVVRASTGIASFR